MGVKFKLADLPPHVIARIRPEDRAALGLVALPAKETSADKGDSEKPEKQRRRPNKTEARYRAEHLRHEQDARYEALSFRFSNGHVYTPDWVVFNDNGMPVSCHEVKGSYKFHSHGRARFAFDQAAIEFPGFDWIWATLTKQGWEIENA